MKKSIFWILIITTVILAFRIANILLFDIKRLTDYGFGYLTGLLILFAGLTCLSIMLGRKIFKSEYSS